MPKFRGAVNNTDDSQQNFLYILRAVPFFHKVEEGLPVSPLITT